MVDAYSYANIWETCDVTTSSPAPSSGLPCITSLPMSTSVALTPSGADGRDEAAQESADSEADGLLLSAFGIKFPVRYLLP